MLLAFDIGNTNIAVGVFKNEELLFKFRLKSDPKRTVDEYASILLSLLERKFGSRLERCESIMSSVVPSLTDVISDMLGEYFRHTPLVVGPGIKTGVPVNIEHPNSAGSDRIVNAAALRRFYGVPGLVVDFGTATTIDYIGPSGGYEGGVIAPGIDISLEALVKNTAKLPNVEIRWPESVVGKNTAVCMQIGSVVGYVCLVDGLVAKIKAEMGGLSHIVSTGGYGHILKDHSEQVTRYDPDLTLKGLKVIYDLNR